ncbi:FHA domain-containing protein [Bacillus sp. ISL-35]|uniref:FHA domain-containing protein n=1 Tax=Bacillus sp. ISL-35 TaxID=2819122 RepID=UPI001BEA3CFF|nr:FHA domain-containing protein [Bacillus sp. ISL-35]MBT2678672.1 FHA domain-containing protein [Bacillus sp. ISL-35]MBT2703664.1 FHA domain-containing protein [Chryseobacterium sp. ISL-80]
MIKHVEFKLESYGISKFLYFHAKSKADIDGGQVELLRASRVPGILPCHAILEGENCFLRYDMISDNTLEMLNSAPATKERLYNSFLNIAETLVDAQASGLDIANFVLSQRDIFIDNFSNRLVFIYLPVKNNIFEKVSLKEFLQELLLSAPYDENDDAVFFIKLHNYLVETDDITPEHLLEKMNELGGDETLVRQPYKMPEKPKQEAAPQAIPVEEPLLESSELETPAINPNFYSPGSEVHTMKTSVDNGVLTSEYTSQKKDVKTGRKLEIEEEVNYKRITRAELGDNNALLKEASALGGGTSINIQPAIASSEHEDEGTTVLGVMADEDEGTTTLGHSVRRPFLLAVSKNEKITIAKDLFKIGRDPMRADFASENKVIGRVHAHVIVSNGEYFLEDNHSTNGSFVNGVKVSPKEKVKIKHEDKIKLANEEFIFRLY